MAADLPLASAPAHQRGSSGPGTYLEGPGEGIWWPRRSAEAAARRGRCRAGGAHRPLRLSERRRWWFGSNWLSAVRDADRHSGSDSDSFADADADAYTDGDTDGDTAGDTDSNGDAHRDCYGHGHGHGHTFADRQPAAEPQPFTDANLRAHVQC